MFAALSWLTGSTVGRYCALAVVSLVIVWTILSRVKASGAKDLQLSQTEKALDILRQRLQHEQDLSNLTREQRLERMRKWTSN